MPIDKQKDVYTRNCRQQETKHTLWLQLAKSLQSYGMGLNPICIHFYGRTLDKATHAVPVLAMRNRRRAPSLVAACSTFG
jgi:hypothetical protein